MRRLMLFVAALALAGVYSLAPSARTARAFEVWCENDPMVQINGVTVNITVSVWQSALPNILGSVPVVIMVPDGTSTAVLPPIGPQLFPETVLFIPFSQSARAAAILGMSRSEVDAADGSGYASQGSHVTVLSVVRTVGLTSYGTKLATSQSSLVTLGQSNQWMSAGFDLPGRF